MRLMTISDNKLLAKYREEIEALILTMECSVNAFQCYFNDLIKTSNWLFFQPECCCFAKAQAAFQRLLGKHWCEIKKSTLLCLMCTIIRLKS